MRHVILLFFALACASAASATVTLAPNNGAIKYSPYNWNITSGEATTIWAGAYFKFKWENTGTPSAVPTLNFDISKMPAGTDASQLWVQVDYENKWTKVALTSGSYTAVLPTETTTVNEHIIRVMVKSTSEGFNSWDPAGSSWTAVRFLGATFPDGTFLNNGQPFEDYDFEAKQLPHKILCYGDSLCAGVRTVTASGETVYQPDDDDSMHGWAFPLGESLGTEVGVVGSGGLGWTRTGAGAVPVFPTSWDHLYSGVARSFSSPPDLIVVNLGTNDWFASANLTGIVTPVLNAIRTANPNVPILVVTPYYGGYNSVLVSEVAAMSDHSGVAVMQFPNAAFGDPFFRSPLNSYETAGFPIHPLRLGSRERVVPQIVANIESLISGYYPVPSGAFPTSLHYLGRHISH